MEYFDGTLQDLLLEEYGGDYIYEELVKSVSEKLGETPENIIFTTTDDETDAVEKFTFWHSKYNNLGINNKSGFPYLIDYAEGGLVTVFIRKQDKEKFESLIKTL